MSEASIRAQICSAESQIDGCNAYIEQLQEKIERLKKVKPAVSEIKSEVYSREMEVHQGIMAQICWVGENKRGYDAIAEQQLFPSYKAYYDGVDEILDSINDEITRMENEIYEQQGIIGKLRSWINSLWNELCNFFN